MPTISAKPQEDSPLPLSVEEIKKFPENCQKTVITSRNTIQDIVEKVGRLDSFTQNIETQSMITNVKFDALNSKLDSINSKIDSINSKLDSVGSKLDALVNGLGGV